MERTVSNRDGGVGPADERAVVEPTAASVARRSTAAPAIGDRERSL